MLALHLSIHHGNVLLWGENAMDASVPSADDHAFPYDPGIQGLRRALKPLLPELRVLKRNSQLLTLWLPSRGEVPLPSSPLLGDPGIDRRRKLSLRPYRMIALCLPLEALLSLTAIACDASRHHVGILFDASFSWCDRLIKLALHSVMGEQYMPGMVTLGNQFEARWFPVLDSEGEKQMAALAQCMPASCRAVGDAMDAAPETSSRQVANQLLAGVLDGMVRQYAQASSSKRSFPSLHDAWLSALVALDATIAWPSHGDLASFSRQLQQWQRPVDLFLKSPFQFSFRLSEPETEDDDAWRVDYLLQPKNDPSLRIPLRDFWQKSQGKNKQLQGFGANASEFVLTALGQAAALSPQVAASMKQPSPDGFTLDAAGACRFLQEQAEALRGAGFSVMLPSWWVGKGPAQKVTLKATTKSPAMKARAGFTLDTIIGFDLRASLGGQDVDLAALKRMAAMKTPLVRLRGQWTMIDRDEIAQALRFLQKQKNGTASARDVVAMALGAEQHFGGMAVAEVETDGWLDELLATLTGNKEFALQPQPQQFVGELRSYQQRGFSWLAFLRQWGLGACLADDMGLGKTIQTLALIQHERAQGETRPLLLICPTSVINNWRKEAERFAPELSVLVHHGPDRRRKAAFVKAAAQHAIVIYSYGLLQRDCTFLSEIDWAGVVLDEAQNIKNPESKQSKAARSIQADYRIALTGTPVENHVGDLWALMDFLNPGLLGNQNAFKNTFFRPIQIWRNAEVAARLKSLTSPFILRRLKTDRTIISDLPDKIEQKAYCTLTKEQASLYQSVVDDMQQKLDDSEGIERRGLVLATLSKLKQVCNHPTQFLGDGSASSKRSGKLERLEEMVAEIHEVGERVLVFTQFSEMGVLMQRHFQELLAEEVLFLHGGTPRKQRDAMVERFQNSVDAPTLFILSLKAGGTGLTLTRANHVIHYDRWWNPAVENQATDRAFRIGQKRNVQVHKFMVVGTLEERIDSMIERKSGIAAQVVGSGEQWLTELSNDELREMIALSRDAVGE